jgi:hypothetical protein
MQDVLDKDKSGAQFFHFVAAQRQSSNVKTAREKQEDRHYSK